MCAWWLGKQICFSVLDILMPKMLGRKKGKGQFAMLQEKMIEKREECLNVNRTVCVGNGHWKINPEPRGGKVGF